MFNLNAVVKQVGLFRGYTSVCVTDVVVVHVTVVVVEVLAVVEAVVDGRDTSS